MAGKNEIRQEMKEKLLKISKPVYEDYSYKIACRLFEQKDWLGAHSIGITVSKYPEVDTYHIIHKAWELGKRVAVPKCVPEKKRLTFRTLTDFSQLESVFYGLLEPIPEKTKEVQAIQLDLLIVPGLAYTKTGLRLGFGGGYYDRFLSDYSGKTLSLAFNEQIISDIPVKDHDIPVAKIITPDRVMNIR